MTNKERKELAQWAINKAKQHNANEASVDITNRREIEIEYRDKKLDKLKESTQNSLTIDIYVDNKFSSQNTNDLRKSSLESFIREAVKSTEYLTKDEFRALPDPKYYPDNLNVPLKINDENYQQISSEQRVKLAKEIEETAMGMSDKIISTTSGYRDTYYETVKINSNGFEGNSKGTLFSASAEVTVKDADARPEDYFYARSRFINDLPTAEEIGKQAVERALRKIGQDKIKSGDYTMIVENMAVPRLVSMLLGAMYASAIQQKRSYLDGMIGKKVAADTFTLIDDPLLKEGLSSRLFDSDGIKAKKRLMIESGILKNYYVDNYYGKKLGLEPTGNSSTNLMLDYGKRSAEEILKDVSKGIYVTGFLGGNSNSTTGDYSFGVSGLLIENGEAVKPISEMNISGNAKEFWNRLSEVGNDPNMYSSWRMPTLVFDDINFSGI